MAEADAPPTLASLRRSLAPRRRGPSVQPSDGIPGLFDSFPALDAPVEAVAAPEAVARPPAPPPSTSPAAPTPSGSSHVTPPLPAPAAPVSREPAPQVQANPGTWTVTGLVRHVRGLVEGGFAHVTVEGEISNWRPAGSGHCYFTLKDSGAQLTAVLFRRQASLLKFQPRDGDAVKIHGQLSVYENRGQLQLIAEWMQQAGLGALLAAVQMLKEKLRQEGLFDRKRPLPPFPRCIGVITSLHGAALRDIVKVCRRRHASVQMLVYPAAVQGPHCPAEIAAGLRWFNAHPDHAEVVLVARGGGSYEDLHGFNHEQVARAIAACSLPVITGIGHATDTTIADAAADVCAPTPSAAAELLTAAQHRVEEHVQRLQGRLLRAGNFELLRARQRLAHLGAQTVLRRVQDGLNRREQRLDELGFRAQTALNQQLRSQLNRLRTTDARLSRLSPTLRLQSGDRRLQALQVRLERMAGMRLAQAQRRHAAATTRLHALSPLRVLDRGYALVYGPEGHLLRSATQALPGQQITARLAEGSFRAIVSAPAEAPA